MPAMKQEVNTEVRIRGFRYFITEAFKNIFSNTWMTLVSVFTVMASLLVLGVFLVLSLNLNIMADKLQDSYEIIVVMDEMTTTEGIISIGRQIKKIDNVNSALLSSKGDRFEDLKTRFGDNAELLDRYNEDNPLRDWYMVTLSDLTKTADAVDKIEDIDGVSKVIQNEEAIGKLIKIATYIKNFSIWIILALAVVSIFIISNTIRLTVYTRRKEINIMKFVGATDWFIRWPFIIEGIIIGIIGSVIAVGLVLLCYNFFVGIVGNLNIMFFTLKPTSEILSLVLWSSFGLGAALGGIGSFISVRKHLNV